MSDIISKLYILIDEELPALPLEYEAERALEQTLTEEQKKLFEAYQAECFKNTEAERKQLCCYLLSLGRRLSRL